METQTLINTLIATIGFLFGWLLKAVRESIRDLQTEHKSLANSDKQLSDKVQAIEILVIGNYVKHDDLEKLREDIFSKLDRIETKLDRKVDR